MASAASPGEVEHIFAIQSDDEISREAFDAHNFAFAETLPPEPWASSSVANWNAAAAKSTGDVLVVIADDLTPCDRWDRLLRMLPPANKAWACYVPDDTRSDGLMCHPVISRALYNQRGYVFHPDYFGVYCDNDFTTRTQLEALIVQIPGMEWRHDHPLNGHTPLNATTQLQNTTTAYAFGETIYQRKWPLVADFNRARNTTGDINEHLLRIAQYARHCNHVTEFGVRSGLSTLAILHGMCDRPNNGTLRSYDLADPYGVYESARSRVATDWTFTHGSTLDIPQIEPTEMLFVDTLHTYAQVKVELARHASQVSKFMVFHDTVSFGVVGEDGRAGINLAIQEFMRDNPHWLLFEHHENNNGLTILSNQYE